jgi:hypothetical protein
VARLWVVSALPADRTGRVQVKDGDPGANHVLFHVLPPVGSDAVAHGLKLPAGRFQKLRGVSSSGGQIPASGGDSQSRGTVWSSA